MPDIEQQRPDLSPTTTFGGVRFVSDEERSALTSRFEEEGALIVEPSKAITRGALEHDVDAAIETALLVNGAETEGVIMPSLVSSEADARLSDQLFRAKKAGFSGIVISLGSLARAAQPMRVLESTDAAHLRFYARATNERPFSLLLHEADMHLGAYGDPMPLYDAIFGPRDQHEALEDEHEEEVATTTREEFIHAHANHDDADHNDSEIDDDFARVEIRERVTDPAPMDERASLLTALEEVASEMADPNHHAIDDESPAPPPLSLPHSAPSHATHEAHSPPIEWRAWASELSAARGPQSLSTLEKLFVHAYTPLDREIGMGLRDALALDARDEFRRGFARAYTEAFATIAVRGRRPKMVLDAWDLSHSVAKSAGARSAHLVIVDAMRFDLGVMMRDSLLEMLDGRATIADESLLFAALPTTSPRQLETLARGKIALTSPSGDLSELDSLRGRASEEARRVRVGSRELRKVDVVTARLTSFQQHGPASILESMPEVADICARAVANVARELPPRSLLYVAGDHGFTFDAEGHLQEGGASPEEVLVPAFSLLLGELH